MKKMPVVFIGHGSPMNAIEDNQFTRNWIEIANKIPKPKAPSDIGSLVHRGNPNHGRSSSGNYL